jgi:hypothetical protein
MWCCQSAEYAKKPKPSDNPLVKLRENLGMDKYHCAGSLSIRVKPHPYRPGSHLTYLFITHDIYHVPYVDVSIPPEALSYIKDQLLSTPSLIASQLAKQFPQLTPAQVYSAWYRLSEAHW